MDINGDMIRGHIDTIILLSLIDGDKDSNEIRKSIEERSDNKFSVKQGTFYSAMQRLVKQNMIREYRSSSDDGIRRKYFSLTEKGLKSVEDNRKEWIESKEVIDTLVDTSEQNNKTEVPVLSEEDFPIPPVDPYLERKQVSASDESDKQEIQSVAAYVSVSDSPDVVVSAEPDTSGDDLLSDFNAKLSDMLGEYLSVDAENGSTQDSSENCEELVDESVDDKIKATAETDDSSAESDNILASSETENDKTIEQPSAIASDASTPVKRETRNYPFEITDSSLYVKDETVFDPTVEITVKHENLSDDKTLKDADEIVSDDNHIVCNDNGNIDTVADRFSDSVETQYDEQKPLNDNSTAIDDNGDDDDLLSIEDGSSINRREYKSILASLFPRNEKQTEQISEQPQVESRKNSDSRDDTPSRTEIDEYYEEKVPASARSLSDDTIDINHTIHDFDNYSDNNGSTDFSDLYAMAKREGFKIKTSYNTNKSDGDRVLINKLNFHSSLLSYLLLFVEMLVLDFTLGHIVDWSSVAKLIIVFATALFPIVTFIIYNINKTRTVKNISQFKDVIEIVLIVTFQLTIIILCIALFASVDFSDFKSVSEFVLIPFIFALNVPLFFMIKYALYGTGKYFYNAK